MFFAIFLINTFLVFSNAEQNFTFPKSFKFGVGTSAYQIEGAWNIDGKGISIWDYATHNQTGKIKDGTNADIACNSYHNLEEDVAMLKYLGVQSYRFSISWPRLFPLGYINDLNLLGVQYYNRLINLLISNNIEPMVTMHHWDLPQNLQDLGGWANPLMADIFVEYADKLFQLFGDRVRTWITFNEPSHICKNAYNGRGAPFLTQDGVGTYMCGHTILKAHGRTFRMYQKKFKSLQKGLIGISAETDWYEPLNATSADDRNVAERLLQMNFAWFVHPIYSQSGDYPPLMKKRIKRVSQRQGFAKSRLPEFTKEEINEIRGTYDFLGVNHYTTFLVTSARETYSKIPSYANDVNAKTIQSANWPETGWTVFRVVPWGLEKLLAWINWTYGKNVPIVITENGFAASEAQLNDTLRINFIKEYLKAVLYAVNRGSNVSGYFFWSLMDNFEWARGYSLKFGLYHVNFNSPNRTRSPKQSAHYYREIIKTRTIY